MKLFSHHHIMGITIICLFFFWGCATERTGLEKTFYDALKKISDSSIALDDAFEKIVALDRMNTVVRLKEGEKTVVNGLQHIDRLMRDVRAYQKMVQKNRKLIVQREMTYYIDINGIFGPEQARRMKAMGDFLNAMKRWVSYSASHFEGIQAGNIQYKKGYERLLMDVNRKLDRHNVATHQFVEFIHAYLKRYPTISSQFKREYKTLEKELGWL